jgi:hypothetical protein
MMIKAEDVYTAAGATGVEDNGVGLGGSEIRGDLADAEGLGGISGRHQEEDEGDEEERHRYYEQYPSEAVDLVRQGLVAEAWPL